MAIVTTTAPADAAPWGVCILCGKRILSAYVMYPAVAAPRRGGTGYTARAHTACAELLGQGLTGDALAAAKAKIAGQHDGLERLFVRWAAVIPAGEPEAAVTP